MSAWGACAAHRLKSSWDFATHDEWGVHNARSLGPLTQARFLKTFVSLAMWALFVPLNMSRGSTGRPYCFTSKNPEELPPNTLTSLRGSHLAKRAESHEERPIPFTNPISRTTRS